MIDSILKLLGSALGIWEHKEKNKFLEQYIDLNKRFYNEKNKPKVDHAVLDNLEFELKLLIDALSAKIREP